MSLDGYITQKDGSLDFLSLVESNGEDYGYHEFNQDIDTIIIGRKTYESVLAMGYEYPHKDKNVYIITRQKKPNMGTFQFYNGDIVDLISSLKKETGKNIYCDGGAEIVSLCVQNNLFDEYIISVIPVLLGGGIKLFKEGFDQLELSLISTKTFEKGLVQLHYKKCKNQ